MLRTTLLLTLLLSTAARAQEPIQLFNGKDLTGWVWVPGGDGQGSKIDDVWSVEEGILKCKGEPRGYIRTEKDFTNYVLKVEWRFSKPGNSGVLLRMQPPDKVWPKSMEAQLNHRDAGDIWNIDDFPAKLDPARTKGRRTVKLHESSEKPIGEWNLYEITFDGPSLELKVNGVVQNNATEVEEVAGKICLQSEGAEIEFRKVELIPLGGDDPAAAATPRAARLAGLEGWHITGNGNWAYHDGIIEGKQSRAEKSYTHVVSDKSYKDFIASLKFKALQGNSGFYFRVKIDEKGNAHGFQAEIDEKRDAGGIYESQGRGWVSQPKKEDVERYFKPGEWNEMTVEARGPQVVVKVNGEKAAEINDPNVRQEGRFALQIHGGQDVHVMFKDIDIQPIE